ncbi:hypothetical protein V6N12_046505 [Hibiscus sabdariffa]|uniref:pyridoxal 5'-phosphate synthase (glutamine hydrolyzing) n=1 Tax=Hibiscus sabdariffa TaxID=183260 RepID=A0ABR2DJU0_9ROSI
MLGSKSQLSSKDNESIGASNFSLVLVSGDVRLVDQPGNNEDLGLDQPRCHGCVSADGVGVTSGSGPVHVHQLCPMLGSDQASGQSGSPVLGPAVGQIQPVEELVCDVASSSGGRGRGLDSVLSSSQRVDEEVPQSDLGLPCSSVRLGCFDSQPDESCSHESQNLGEALWRIREGVAMIRTKGEVGTDNIIEVVRHMRFVMGDIRVLRNMDDDEAFTFAKKIQSLYDLVMHMKQLGRLPVLGYDGVFVWSGVFKSSDPARRARVIVQVVTHYNDPEVLAEVSCGLGEAMVGINLNDKNVERFAARSD